METKKRQIRETQLEAEQAVLAKRQAIQDQDMAGRICVGGQEQEPDLLVCSQRPDRSGCQGLYGGRDHEGCPGGYLLSLY